MADGGQTGSLSFDSLAPFLSIMTKSKKG